MNIKCGYKSINGDYVFSFVAKKVQEYKKITGNEVVDLGVGDVKFPPPKSICTAIKQESKKFCSPEFFCGYPDECGILSLRTKISEYYNGLGAKVSEDEIFITTGAKPALGELFEVCDFKNAGIILPTYPLYEELCALHGTQVEFIYSNSENFFPLPRKKVDALFICSPNNPAGHTLSEKNLKEVINYTKKQNALAVIDGAYADFTQKYICPYKFSESENIVEVRSYSKNLCFTGLRCGYVVIKKQNPLHGAYKKYLSLRSNGVNVIMQRTAILSYMQECKQEVLKRVNYYRQNAKILKKVLKSKNLTYSGGVNVPYLLVNVRKSGQEFFEELLNNCGVVVTPGEAFHANNCVRISCLAHRNQIEKGAKILNEFLK